MCVCKSRFFTGGKAKIAGGIDLLSDRRSQSVRDDTFRLTAKNATQLYLGLSGINFEWFCDEANTTKRRQIFTVDGERDGALKQMSPFVRIRAISCAAPEAAPAVRSQSARRFQHVTSCVADSPDRQTISKLRILDLLSAIMSNTT